MDAAQIRAKFGGNYCADENTFKMGIDLRFTSRIAERFRGLRVLETCTGAGFSTIALAREAARVTTVEIEPRHREQARKNLEAAGVLDRVTLVAGDILDEVLWAELPEFDSAFLDPDWAVTGSAHRHRFLHSTTKPPADRLLARVLRATQNVALVLPPDLDPQELAALPPHERQKLFLDGSHELFCLYFGQLAACVGETEMRV